MFIATVETTPNIALVKYWGKRNEGLMLPMNSSISVTLSDEVKTKTTVMFSDKFNKDEVYLGERKVNGNEHASVVKILNIIRKGADSGLKAKVVSVNYFPTAAGLASSASGFAALACASAKALKLKIGMRKLSILARLGSGSASRSVYGGFVEWQKGVKKDGSDSYAKQLANEKHWPELRNVIAIVSREKKKVSSRAGMKTTVQTSSLYKCRIAGIERTLGNVRKAIRERDCELLFTEMMKDSNDMHATMLDTFPPIMYLNDVSRRIIDEVHEINGNGIKAGYTFDAGPNAHVFTLQRNASEVVRRMGAIKGVEKVIVCKVGRGPRYLKEYDNHQIEPETGEVR